MTANQKEILRDALVTALVLQSPLSLPAETLQGVARAAGFKLAEDELAREIQYLADKGMAEAVPVKLSAGVKRWKATAAAVEYAEEKGLC